jgi:hypothetical protein
MSRVRPADSAWPSEASWDRLGRAVEGRLVRVRSPLDGCLAAPSSPACAQVFKNARNPYHLGDEVGLTQCLGWAGAWTSRLSVHAVAAETTDDVVAAVDFALRHDLRLVVKGGGHSYQGTSNAADSLLTAGNIRRPAGFPDRVQLRVQNMPEIERVRPATRSGAASSNSRLALLALLMTRVR